MRCEGVRMKGCHGLITGRGAGLCFSALRLITVYKSKGFAHYQKPCVVIIPNCTNPRSPYNHHRAQGLHKVNRFNTMSRDASTQETNLSDPTLNSEGNSTNFTGSSDKSGPRSDAPKKPTLAEDVFEAYKAREDCKVTVNRVYSSPEGTAEFGNFWKSYYKWEAELEAEEEGSGLGLGVQDTLRLYNAVCDVPGAGDWPKEVHKGFRDCFKADNGSPL